MNIRLAQREQLGAQHVPLSDRDTPVRWVCSGTQAAGPEDLSQGTNSARAPRRESERERARDGEISTRTLRVSLRAVSSLEALACERNLTDHARKEWSKRERTRVATSPSSKRGELSSEKRAKRGARARSARPCRRAAAHAAGPAACVFSLSLSLSQVFYWNKCRFFLFVFSKKRFERFERERAAETRVARAGASSRPLRKATLDDSRLRLHEVAASRDHAWQSSPRTCVRSLER